MVVAYEYPGYGASKGVRSSDYALMAFAEHALRHIGSTLNVKYNKVIAYGESIGSGPSIFLAAKFNLAGVIVNSGFTAGSHIGRKTHLKKKFSYYELFPNIELIKMAKCPVFLIHGKKDRIFHWSHSQTLYEASQSPYPPFFSENCGHCEVEFKEPEKYFEEMDKFLCFLAKSEKDKEVLVLNDIQPNEGDPCPVAKNQAPFILNENSDVSKGMNINESIVTSAPISNMLHFPFLKIRHKYSKNDPLKIFYKRNKISMGSFVASLEKGRRNSKGQDKSGRSNSGQPGPFIKSQGADI